MVEEIIKEVKEKQLEINKLKSELQQKSKESFFKGVKEIFNSCPDLKSVAWTQYTPYFNDGDTCEFSAQTDYLEVNGSYDSKELEPEIVVTRGNWNHLNKRYDGRECKPNPSYNKSLSDCVDNLSRFIGVFDDDFYKEMFGDHKRVKLTPNGIDVEDYEHE